MEVRYAESEGHQIAYGITGEGPVDLVLVPGFISHLEIAWEEPLFASFLERLTGFCRLIQFDKRGMGLSDHLPGDVAPTLEQRVADIGAVLDAAGAKRAVLFAWSEGGPASLRFAAERPDRTAGLILHGTTARFTEAPDYAGIPRIVMETWIDGLSSEWGTGIGLWGFTPTLFEDERLLQWWARYQRFAATPKAVASSLRMYLDVDVRDILGSVQAPALIVHVQQDILVPVAEGRYMAEHLPNARIVELDGADHMFWVIEPDRVLEEMRSFLASLPEGSALAGTRSRRPTSGWEALTNAERRVADLVAEGFSNAEIGTRLFVTKNTVESHLKRIYRKLDVRSRAELASEAARRKS